jgi:hypothetical protein
MLKRNTINQFDRFSDQKNGPKNVPANTKNSEICLCLIK